MIHVIAYLAGLGLSAMKVSVMKIGKFEVLIFRKRICLDVLSFRGDLCTLNQGLKPMKSHPHLFCCGIQGVVNAYRSQKGKVKVK